MPENSILAALLNKRRAVYQQLYQLKAAQTQLNARSGKRLRDLHHQADKLAQEFKTRLHNAKVAWEQDDRALAKTLSQEGRELERQCRELNEEAHGLRAAFKELYEAIGHELAQITKLNELIRELRPRQTPRTTASYTLRGFSEGEGVLITQTRVRNLVDSFPAEVVAKVRLVTYRGHAFLDHQQRVITGRTAQRSDGIYEIEVFLVTDPALRPLQTIAHELGHIAYRTCLTEKQRSRWGELYLLTDTFISENGERSAEEDFCEFVGYIYTEPHVAVANHTEKTNFVARALGLEIK